MNFPRCRMNIRALLRDERGSAMMLFAFFLMVGAGFAAIVIDGGYVYSLKSKLQTTADAAVLVAVGELPDSDVARTAAIGMAGKNMPTGEHGAVLANADVVTGNWDSATQTFTAGGTPLNAVRVVTRRSQVNGNAAGLFFARVLGFNQVDVETTAIAALGEGSSVCIHALSPNVQRALHVNNGTLVANGCDIQVNSTHASRALSVASNGVINMGDSGEICVNGGIDNDGTVTPAPVTGCDPVSDPLVGLKAPSYSGCNQTDLNLGAGDYTLYPGVYCGGLDMMGADKVTFEPGIYIMDGAMHASGQEIEGEGVSFYFTPTNQSKLNITGQSVVHLSAPTSGEMQGILFYGDRTASKNLIHVISGQGELYLEGTIYFPANEMRVSGDGVTEVAPYTNVIADRLQFSGNGALTFNSDIDDSSVPLPLELADQGIQLVR